MLFLISSKKSVIIEKERDFFYKKGSFIAEFLKG
jgi:hypothetical protein